MKRFFEEHRLFIIMAVICLVAVACDMLGWARSANAMPLIFFGLASMDQPNTLQDILKWEMQDNYSREVVTVLSGQDLDMGTVVGKVTLGTCPTSGTAGSNTGAGTCTGVTAGAKAKLGVYTLMCIHAVSAGGIFSVEDPDGFGLPDAVVGKAYVNDQINFTLNDSSPDFSAGDTFTITIAVGSLKVRAVAAAALTGYQDAYGILIAAVDASAGDVKGVAIVRDAKIVAANLVWPDESPLNDTAWLAQLAAKGIIAVTEI